jgi:23S rRNA (adenine2503-C2)-methyltransferase
MAISTFVGTANLLGLDRSELVELVMESGKPPFRGAQLFHSIYRRRVRNLSECTELPVRFREYLETHCRVGYPEVQGRIASRDGSVRYLLGLNDGETIETVFMPDDARFTLCVSSQAGCAVNCRFCFTALLGVKRNLTAGEILGQIMAVIEAERVPVRARINVVFMGMGEPLLNLKSVMKAARILARPDGLAIPLRRVTISTAGIVPKIYELGRESERPKLAISLNASTEEQRTELMPVTHKYSLARLLRACREFPLQARERLTFEYVLLDGVNDSDADALRVTHLLRGIRSKVNLIPYNPGAGLPYQPSPLARVLAFQEILRDHHLPAFVRISRGRDIMAACGQLRLAGVPDAASPEGISPPSSSA